MLLSNQFFVELYKVKGDEEGSDEVYASMQRLIAKVTTMQAHFPE